MILHIFTITAPTDVNPFPPSVVASGWSERLSAGASANGGYIPVSGSSKTLFVWNSEEELTNFVNTYRLADATLISDLDAWKAAHGITFTTVYYTVSGSDITTPGVVS